MEKDLANIYDAGYQQLIDSITSLWNGSKAKAATAVNTDA